MWFSSNEVTDWFTDIKDKNHPKFIQLDISNCYTSINLILLNKTLIFAMRSSALFNKDIILKARKSIIEFEGKYWERKDKSDLIINIMESSNSALVLNSVGIHTLKCINSKLLLMVWCICVWRRRCNIWITPYLWYKNLTTFSKFLNLCNLIVVIDMNS